MSLLELGSKKYIKKVFEYSDRGNKGHLTRHEYNIAMIAFFGSKPLKWEKDRIFGSNKRKTLSFNEFMDIIMQKVKFCEYEQSIREVFLQFDGDWKGFLEIDDLKKAQIDIFPHLNPQICEKAFDAADLNKDGRVSYGEFHDIFTLNVKNE